MCVHIIVVKCVQFYALYSYTVVIGLFICVSTIYIGLGRINMCFINDSEFEKL